MKIVFIILLFLAAENCVTDRTSRTSKQEESIEQAIHSILELASQDNIDKLNQEYINDSIGIYELKKIGTINHYLHNKKINKETSATGTMYQILTTVKDVNQKVKYYDDLKYDCDNYEWNKQGLIISKVSFFNCLPKEDVSSVKLNTLKEKVYRVVLTDDDLVFYLANFNNRFYLVGIDRIITDCGA